MKQEQQRGWTEESPLVHEEKKNRFNKKVWIPLGTVVLILLVILLLGAAFLIYETKFRKSSSKTIHSEMSISNLMQHLSMLQEIAYNTTGRNRYIGTPGFYKTGDYIISQLQAAGYNVTIQPFSEVDISSDTNSTLSLTTPELIQYVRTEDFYEISDCPPVNLTAVKVTLIAEYGCMAGDYAQFNEGDIALIRRDSNCSLNDAVKNATVWKPSAIIVIDFDDDIWKEYLSFQVSVPVLTISNAVGQLWLQFLKMNQSLEVSVVVSNFSRVWSNITAFNIIADTAGGRVNRTVVIGSHFDSVAAGPGINDNGSGLSTTLEIALIVAKLKLKVKNRLRFIFFGAEEQGKVGSTYYVTNLLQNNIEELNNIALMLNLDMIASQNWYRAVYNGSTAAENVANGSTIISNLINQYWEKQKLYYYGRDLDGRSDYQSFIDIGIPSGGISSGSSGIKSVAQAKEIGGLANVQYDPCYHRSCDTVDNINQYILDQHSHAMAYAMDKFAGDEQLVDSIFAGGVGNRSALSFDYAALSKRTRQLYSTDM